MSNLKFLFGMLLLAGLACSLGGQGNGSPDTSADDPNLLFYDDFSAPSNNWTVTFNDELGMVDFDQGGFRILVNQPSFDYWATPGLSHRDVSVRVDAKMIGGPEDNDFGLICRLRDDSNFYFFLATSDGFFAVGKNTDEGQIILNAEAFEETRAVRSGDAVNQLRADCVGDMLTFYINGTQVAAIRDSDHSSGDVGLMAGTFDFIGTDILFDNFEVRRP